METTKALTEFYTNYDEEGRLLSKHGQVEFLTTMRYIEKYLKPGMRILEIGAATGRYSHTLARMGCRVDAVELIAHNIDLFRANTQPGEDVSVRQGNAKDKSQAGKNLRRRANKHAYKCHCDGDGQIAPRIFQIDQKGKGKRDQRHCRFAVFPGAKRQNREREGQEQKQKQRA